MAPEILSVLLAGAVILAILLGMTIKPEVFSRLALMCMGLSVLGGLFFYGFGFYEVTGSFLMTVFRAPVMVFRMFMGVNELSTIQGTWPVAGPVGIRIFWLFHLLAFFSIASAVTSTLGAETLRHLRFLLSRVGDLTVIYGISEKGIELGKECVATGDSSVVFITDNVSPEEVQDLNAMGMAVIAGPSAVSCDDRVIRRLRRGRRTITVYAIDDDADRDLFFALRMKEALERNGIPAENTRITLPGAEDIVTSLLQVSGEKYGFGYVNAYDAADLSARALIRLCPPWESVSFGEDGRATENYECAVVGFGSHGQAALRQLVMNGQFLGSTFRATVFSPTFSSEAGYFKADSPKLMKRYDIRVVEADGRSEEFYSFLRRRLKTLKLVAVCTGDEDSNREVSDNLMLFLSRCGADHIRVVRCGDLGVLCSERVGGPIRAMGIYTRELLSARKADRNAILINAVYDTSERTDWEKWVDCDSFSKMSSRASADFVPAFIRAAGTSPEEMISGNWHPSDEMLDNLGHTEHLRWSAFHFANGYRTMSDEEFMANAAEWKRCEQQGIPCNIRISKNTAARTHACLIPWDELDALSEKESAITGKDIDYKQHDINNILALPKLLRESGEKRE